MNPESNIKGKYFIISDEDLNTAVKTALKGSGFEIYWNDKQTSYIIRSEDMLRKSWDVQVKWLFDALDILQATTTLLSGDLEALICGCSC